MCGKCEYSVTKKVFFKKAREQNIRDARCLSGNSTSKSLPGSKNNETSYFKTDSQLSKHKVYIEVMWILSSILTIEEKFTSATKPKPTGLSSEVWVFLEWRLLLWCRSILRDDWSLSRWVESWWRKLCWLLWCDKWGNSQLIELLFFYKKSYLCHSCKQCLVSSIFNFYN